MFMAAFRSNRIALLACASLATVPLLSVAQSALFDSSLPIAVDADTYELDRKNQLATFYGVRVTQGNLAISADRADTDSLEFTDTKWIFTGNVLISTEDTRIDADEARLRFINYELVSAIVTGNPATFERQTVIDGKTTMTNGRAGVIDFDVANSVLKLESEAWLHDGANEISGSVLRYEMQAGRIIADSDDDGTQRVHIKIVPPEENGDREISVEPEQ